MASVFYPSKGRMRYKDQVASLFIGEHILSQRIYVVGFVWIMCNQDCPLTHISWSNTVIK